LSCCDLCVGGVFRSEALVDR